MAKTTIVLREAEYGEKPPREVLVIVHTNGALHVAIREQPGASWGPPLREVTEVVEEDPLEPALRVVAALAAEQRRNR